MTLESDIKQDRFTSEKQKSFVNIIYTYHYLVDKSNEKFKHYDITRQQFNVLRILKGQHPQPSTVNLIKDRMLDKMSDASRIIDRLLKKELIIRKQSKTDRRAVEIHISEKGIKILEQINPEIAAFQEDFPLTEQDSKLLNDLLDKLRNSN